MDYQHIEDLEKIMDDHQQLIDSLQGLIQAFRDHQSDYQKLRNYYGSEAYFNDVEASNAGDIPSDIKQGILSEDAIFNLIGDNYQLAIDMLELGTEICKYH